MKGKKTMTKKVFLGISAFLNFLTFAACGIMTYQMWASLNTNNSEASGVGEGFAALGVAIVMVVFGIATAAALLTFILKLIAVKVQHNAMTFFAMIFDIALVVLAVAISYESIQSIIAGNVADTLGAIAVVAVPVIPLVCDLISFPHESSI